MVDTAVFECDFYFLRPSPAGSVGAYAWIIYVL